jgi:peptidoglycan/LPS O-acetylase OafA/YrhL
MVAAEVPTQSGPGTTAGSEGSFRIMVLLDAIRGLAALYVMVGHLRQFLWIGYATYARSDPSAVGRLLALASGALNFGHKAVIVFFVVSGFCIHYKQAARSDDEGSRRPFQVVEYARRRARRLYPPLLVALLLTVVFDQVGARVNPQVYPPAIMAARYSLLAVMGNLLMQADLWVPHFGSNLPLWSLAYEAWFYVLYPALLFLILRQGIQRVFAAVAIVSFVALFLTMLRPLWPLDVAAYWVIWVLGALLAEYHFRRANFVRRLPLLAVFSLVLVFWAITRTLVVADVAFGIAFAAALSLVIGRQGRIVHRVGTVAERIAPLGKMSYSLYLTHFPLVVLVSAWWLSTHRFLPRGAELAVGGGVAALCLASVVYLLAERPTTSRRPIEEHAAP